MRKASKDIHLTSYDELLGIDHNNIIVDQVDGMMVVEVPLEQLYAFKNHPFHVRDDAKMAETVESIRTNGVLVPGIVRKRNGGGYELIAGHRRKRGSELAGKKTMPVMIRDYTDDEAVIIMVDSNIQRDDIRPSEKAYAYKMKLEALKHQGVKKDNDAEAADLVGKEAGDSGRKVQRYIRLTGLIPDLLEMVDSGDIKVTIGESLSFLSREEQMWVFGYMTEENVKVTGAAAQMLKESSKEGTLTESGVELILQKKERPMPKKMFLSAEKFREFFPEDYSPEQIEEVIFDLLKDWKRPK